MRLSKELTERILQLAGESGRPLATARPAGSPAPISEKAFDAQVVALAKRHGWLTYHTHNSRRSEPGFPDRVFLRAGVLIIAELKTEDGELRPDQKTWLEELALVDGIIVRLWRPSDWQEIVQMLTSNPPHTRQLAANNGHTRQLAEYEKCLRK